MQTFNKHFPVIVKNAYGTHMTKEEVILNALQQLLSLTDPHVDSKDIQLGFPISRRTKPQEILNTLKQCEGQDFYLRFNPRINSMPVVLTGNIKDKLDILVKVLTGVTFGKFDIEEIVLSLPNTKHLNYSDVVDKDFLLKYKSLLNKFPTNNQSYSLMNSNNSNITFVDYEGLISEQLKNGPLYPLTGNIDSKSQPIDFNIEYIVKDFSPKTMTLEELIDGIFKIQSPIVSLNLMDGTPIVIRKLSRVGIRSGLESLSEWGIINEDSLSVNLISSGQEIKQFNMPTKEIQATDIKEIADSLTEIDSDDIFSQKNYFSDSVLCEVNKLSSDEVSNYLSIDLNTLNRLFNLYDSFKLILTNVPTSFFISIIKGDVKVLTPDEYYEGEDLFLLKSAFLEQLNYLGYDIELITESLLVWYSLNTPTDYMQGMEPIIEHLMKNRESDNIYKDVVKYIVTYLESESSLTELQIQKELKKVLEHARVELFKYKDNVLTFLVKTYHLLLEALCEESDNNMLKNSILKSVSNDPLV